MKHILFLCSGNYYRSRFAEILFNHLAQENDLDWIADSRGIIAQSSYNPGPISEATIEGLNARSIAVGPQRFPMQLSEADLTQADRIIALYDREHRQMIHQFFPNWLKNIEFWNVPDLDEMTPEKALELIERNVGSLVDALSQHKQVKEVKQ